MKVCKQDFPLGSYPNQQSPGYYLDENLASNIDILAKKIVKDMDFVLLVSGNGMVRVGKSALAQQVGTYYTHQVNKKHKLNNTFNENNIVFDSAELIDRALDLPKYSVLILDEGDDLTENYWSQVSRDLKRFFRKCGQLNLFLILLIPDYFEMNKSYAITRSVALLNVKFYGAFERGMFQFFDFETKKELYLKGKRDLNYRAAKPAFDGSFINLYTIGDKKYREMKRKNLEEDNRDEYGEFTEYEKKMGVHKINKNAKEFLLKRYLKKRLINFLENKDEFKRVKVVDFLGILGISESLYYKWIKEDGLKSTDRQKADF